MINPEKKADILRQTLIKPSSREISLPGERVEYLVAQIGGQGQDPGEKKVLDVYFRYKDCLDPIENPDWFSATLAKVWSPKFLGLKQNFFHLPVEQIKKLEFQNPSYAAAFRIFSRKGDPRKYARVFTFQVAGCNFDCNYCFVPPQLKSGDVKFGKYFSAKEIVDHFLRIKKERENEDWNILRITGGEALTITPEIIFNIQKELERKSPQTYLWIETNLSCSKYIKKFERELKEVFKKNVGIVGCFKGVNEKDFSILTGVESRFYENQFETARLLIDLGADIYFYFPALIYEDNIEEKIENFIKKLRKINKNLPLRTEIISIIEDYPASKINIKEKEKEGRPLPKTDQRIVFDLWYNKMLPKFYSKEDLEKYCCEIKLD